MKIKAEIYNQHNSMQIRDGKILIDRISANNDASIFCAITLGCNNFKYSIII